MDKICSIHQPNFLPWLGYFYKIANSDVFVILDTVDIEINTSKAITNRTKIKSPSGEQWLTIPLKKNNDSKLIKDIQYLDTSWRDKILKTISLNYKKTPNYETLYPLLEEIILYDSLNLNDFNTNAIIRICQYLNIKTEILKASELNINSTDRNYRIIEICKKLESNIYFSGNGGKKYHDEQLFKENNIKISYTSFSPNPYPQKFGSFIQGLSVIDYLFNSIEEFEINR